MRYPLSGFGVQLPRSLFFQYVLLGLLGIAWTCGVQLQAGEAVLMKNGDRVSGIVVSEGADYLIISNAWNGLLRVPLDQVDQRGRYEDKADVPLADKKAETGTLSTNQIIQAGILGAKPVGGNVKKPEPRMSWHADLEAGLDVHRGVTRSDTYHARAKLTQIYKPLRNVLDYSLSYGKTDNAIATDQMDGSLKSDYDVGRDLFVYNLASAGYDQVRKISLRYDEGPGMGYHLFTRTNWTADLESGVNYHAEEREDGTRVSDVSMRFSEYAKWKVTDRIIAEERLEFMPRFDRLQDFLVRFETTWKYMLGANLSLNLTLVDQYDTNPAQGVPKNDIQIRSAVGVKF